jgi:hypothetical protein
MLGAALGGAISIQGRCGLRAALGKRCIGAPDILVRRNHRIFMRNGVHHIALPALAQLRRPHALQRFSQLQLSDFGERNLSIFAP